jgi:hypothetical protein
LNHEAARAIGKGLEGTIEICGPMHSHMTICLSSFGSKPDNNGRGNALAGYHAMFRQPFRSAVVNEIGQIGDIAPF